MNKVIDVYKNDPEATHKDQPDLDTLLVIMRLVVGGAMEGADELHRRLKQQALNQSRAAAITVFPADETDLERLRYMLLGLLFETPGVIARSLSRVRQNTQRAADRASKLTQPLTNSWLLRPARRRYEKLVARREAFVDRLAEIGRLEEQTGRVLARDAVVETLDELLAFVAEKPEIRQIVQEQGLSLTSEVVQALRQRTAAADDLVDRVLRRGKPESPPEMVDIPAAALPENKLNRSSADE